MQWSSMGKLKIFSTYYTDSSTNVFNRNYINIGYSALFLLINSFKTYLQRVKGLKPSKIMNILTLSGPQLLGARLLLLIGPAMYLVFPLIGESHIELLPI